MKMRILFLGLVLATPVLILNSLQAVHAAPTLQGELPDLTLLDIVSDPPNPLPWDSLHYISYVRNQGNARAEVNVWYYIDGTRVTGENEYWGHLDPSYTREVDFGHSGLSEGWHTIRFVVDPQNTVNESNEANNEIEETFCIGTCAPQYPDLIVPQINWTPSSPLVDDSMHFTVHVENQGDSNTSPWGQVGVRLFIDSTSIGDDYVSNITPGTTETFDFYWTATAGYHTVRAISDYGDFIPESNESNNEREESFDVDCPTPTTPSLTSPSNGSSACDTTPSFDWSSVSGATSYRIQVDNNSSFGSPEIDTTTSSSNYTPGSALSPGTYYWRVRASNSCGDGSWSSVWSVTILGTVGVPSLYSPSNGSSTCDTTPYFDWSSVSGATSYRIQVDNNSNFSSPVIDTTTSNSYYTPGSPLSPGTYHWRVRASN